MQRRIFGFKSVEETGGWRRLQKLHNLYDSPNIITVIRSRRINLEGHVARMREMINAFNILVGKPERKNHSEGLGIDGKLILERISGKWSVKLCTGLIRMMIGKSGGLL
jgi:hypothetical protein